MISFDMLVLLLLTAGLVVFIGEPLVSQRHTLRFSQATTDPQRQEIEQLNLQKEGLYTAIHDLDFDYQTGKVDQQDYAELRSQLEGEAIETLRELDQIDPLAALDETLERRIASLRAAPAEATLSTHVGSACGTDYPHDARFCIICGQTRSIS